MSEGKKFDEHKIPLQLLPFLSIEEVVKVLRFGRDKYGSWNWTQGMDWSRLLGAALRHLFLWARGEDLDKESGLSHLAHASCCVLMLLHYSLTETGKDDRFKIEKK